jgi:hypothetical protein
MNRPLLPRIFELVGANPGMVTDIATKLAEELMTLHAKVTENRQFPAPSGRSSQLHRIMDHGAPVQLPSIESVQKEFQRSSRAVSLPPIMPDHVDGLPSSGDGEQPMSEVHKTEIPTVDGHSDLRPLRMDQRPDSQDRRMTETEYPRALGDGLPQYQPFW